MTVSSGSPPHAYPGVSFERVLEALAAHGRRIEYTRPHDVMAQCPCDLHSNGDRTPSLHVWWERGQTSVHCFAGGTGQRPHHDVTPVLEPIGLTAADLFDAPLIRRDGRPITPITARPSSRGRTDRPAAPPAPDWAQPKKKPLEPGLDLGEEVSKTKVTSYFYVALPPDGSAEPERWERVDRFHVVREHGTDKTFTRWHWGGQRWHKGAINTIPGRKCTCRWHREQGPLPDPVLYNFPAVRRAVDEDVEIWVVEGEKDADTLNTDGLCATTNISGGGAWLDSYTDALAGGRIVLCLDRDRPGWQRGLRLAEQLRPVAKQLRIVVPPAQAPDGTPLKDVTDLRTAGMPYSDLVQLEPAPADDGVVRLDDHRRERDSGPGGPPGGNGPSEPDDWPGIPNTRPTYLRRQGAIVEQTWTRGKSGDPATPKFTILIDAVARIVRTTYLDDGTDEDSPAIHDYVVEVHREHPDTGEITDPGGTWRIPADDVASGRWPDRIPMRNLIVGKQRSAKDKAWDALEWVTADAGGGLDVRDRRAQPVYAAPGWRRSTPQGPIYVHAGGAIGAAGTVDVEAHLDGEFGGMRLPEPERDPAVLRQAWDTGMAPLLELPARIIAPLLGITMWASVCGAASHVTHLVGAPGSAKTFAARSVLQLFHPGLLYKTEHQEMASARNSTSIGLTRSLGRARDTVLFIDDFAPDDAGGATAMASKLAHIARMLHNRSKRTKAQRFGKGNDNDPAPTGSVITTGELGAGGSAETRCLNITVGDGDLNRPGVQQRTENRRTANARGLLGASFLMWAAGRLDEVTTQVRGLTYGPGSYHDAWAARLVDLPHSAGIRSRIADGVATSSAGIRLLLDWLLDAEILTRAEVEQIWSWAVTGLDETARAQDVDATDPAEHLLSTLRGLVGARRGYFADFRGDAPHPEDLDYASHYGWSWQPRPGLRAEFGSTAEGGQWTHQGDLLGEITDDHIKLLPNAVVAAARAAAARADERWADTVPSLSNAMDARGWLEVNIDKNGHRDRRPSVQVCGTKNRAWQIPKALFDGDDPENPTDGPAPGPLPTFDPDAPPDDSGTAESDNQPENGSATGGEDPIEGEPDFTDPEFAAPDEDETVGVPDEHGPADGADQQADAEEATTVTLDELVSFMRGCPGNPLDHITMSHASPLRPCAACQTQCSLDINGCRVHLACLLTQLQVTVVEQTVSQPEMVGAPEATRPAEPAAPAPTPAGPAPRRDRIALSLPIPAPPGDRWRYAAAVLDVAGIYLPDGRVVGGGAIQHAGDVLAAGERLAVGHRGGPGQLWLTEALCEQLGLLSDPDPVVPGDDGQPRRLDSDELHELTLSGLAEVGRAFLRPATEAGWHVDGDALRPVTRLRRGAPGSGQRVLEIALEPYHWLWDPRGAGLTAADPQHPAPLPDMGDPALRWSELARRAGRAAELFGRPVRMSAAHTGADLFDAAQKRREAAGQRGPKIDAAGRNRARVVRRAGPMPVLRGGQRGGYDIERPFAWSIPISAERLAAADFAHGFDARAQFLPAAKGLALGYCEEGEEVTHVEDLDAIRAVLAGTAVSKLPFGLWRVTLPPWTEPRLPAPHPAQLDHRPVRTWVTSPTLRLLLEDVDDRGGAGYTVDELDPDEAYTWPQAARLLDGPWYDTLRSALDASKNDPPMQALVKATYAGYIGRMGSAWTLGTPDRPAARPWHHQPVWRQAIIAAARAEEFRKIGRAARERDLWPVAIVHDEVVYLAQGPDAADPQTVAPAADNGRPGALRHRRSVRLTDELRARARVHRGDLVKAKIWNREVGVEDLVEEPASDHGTDPNGSA